MKHILLMMLLAASLTSCAQESAPIRPYNEKINPIEQIDSAINVATVDHRNLLLQVGGNWCKWCLRFAKLVSEDAELSEAVAQNYHFLHVNYPASGARDTDVVRQLQVRIKHAERFGFPVLVVMSPKGEVLHIQDSGLLEEGDGYNKASVLRFLQMWSPDKTSTSAEN